MPHDGWHPRDPHEHGPHEHGHDHHHNHRPPTRRVVLAACGTSWHAALVGEYLIERLAHLPVLAIVVGTAERELNHMQFELSAMLSQKSRLATFWPSAGAW